MQTHRLDIIHTAHTIRTNFARSQARARGELRAPTHRALPKETR